MNTLRNRVTLIGNLGFDPEVREIAEKRRVARMSICTNDSYYNKEGEIVEDTQWHTVVAWGSTADRVATLLKKGSLITMEGRLVHRSYEDNGGSKRYVTEIVLSSFELLK